MPPLEAVNDPALGVCLDVANSICAGEWPEETTAMLAPSAINLHLKDYVIDPDPCGVGFRIRGVPPGTGRADIPWIPDQLAHCDADMGVIVEHWLPLGASLEEGRRNSLGLSVVLRRRAASSRAAETCGLDE
ncbi:MAG: TIM barrel protein [Tropicimonas sp.]|uniref:TIM barrel protein n=1 Tax=Tropicimonas sp. TaxID=2067044 RepID=UPI003A89EB66